MSEYLLGGFARARDAESRGIAEFRAVTRTGISSGGLTVGVD